MWRKIVAFLLFVCILFSETSFIAYAKQRNFTVDNVIDMAIEHSEGAQSATIEKIKKEIELQQAKDAIKDIETFGLDYTQMTEQQQYTLGAYVNLMAVSTGLLVDPILGLQTKFSEDDYEAFVSATGIESPFKKIIISLANLLYKIELDDTVALP